MIRLVLAAILMFASLPDGATLAAAPANATCQPPALDPTAHFGPSRAVLGARSEAFRLTRENFEAAYRRACNQGDFRSKPLIPSGTPRGDTLFLRNAPQANFPSIYRSEGEGEAPGVMLLEYPFVTDDGEFHVPDAEDLREAIYCSVHGDYAAEHEEGRCLPD